MGLENRENRWEIKKIGLLNYWWYDEEEFEFADGRGSISPTKSYLTAKRDAL